MKAEQVLEKRCKENLDLLVLSGSRLYGMNTEMSDHDYRGVILPPYEYRFLVLIP